MAVVIETIMGEDLDLGVGDVEKTHPSGGSLLGTQISLSTFSVSGPDGEDPAETVTPGTIAAGSQWSYEMDADGASLGDKVLVSFTGAITGAGTNVMLISAYVSSANHVRVVIANLSGTSFDVAEGTLSCIVFKTRQASV